MKHPLRRSGLFLLAGGLTVLLVGPFLVPVPPPKGTFSPHELAEDDADFITINGLDIHVKKVGRGEQPNASQEVIANAGHLPPRSSRIYLCKQSSVS